MVMSQQRVRQLEHNWLTLFAELNEDKQECLLVGEFYDLFTELCPTADTDTFCKVFLDFSSLINIVVKSYLRRAKVALSGNLRQFLSEIGSNAYEKLLTLTCVLLDRKFYASTLTASVNTGAWKSMDENSVFTKLRSPSLSLSSSSLPSLDASSPEVLAVLKVVSFYQLVSLVVRLQSRMLEALRVLHEEAVKRAKQSVEQSLIISGEHVQKMAGVAFDLEGNDIAISRISSGGSSKKNQADSTISDLYSTKMISTGLKHLIILHFLLINHEGEDNLLNQFYSRDGFFTLVNTIIFCYRYPFQNSSVYSRIAVEIISACCDHPTCQNSTFTPPPVLAKAERLLLESMSLAPAIDAVAPGTVVLACESALSDNNDNYDKGNMLRDFYIPYNQENNENDERNIIHDNDNINDNVINERGERKGKTGCASQFFNPLKHQRMKSLKHCLDLLWVVRFSTFQGPPHHAIHFDPLMTAFLDLQDIMGFCSRDTSMAFHALFMLSYIVNIIPIDHPTKMKQLHANETCSTTVAAGTATLIGGDGRIGDARSEGMSHSEEGGLGHYSAMGVRGYAAAPPARGGEHRKYLFSSAISTVKSFMFGSKKKSIRKHYVRKCRFFDPTVMQTGVSIMLSLSEPSVRLLVFRQLCKFIGDGVEGSFLDEDTLSCIVESICSRLPFQNDEYISCFLDFLSVSCRRFKVKVVLTMLADFLVKFSLRSQIGIVTAFTGIAFMPCEEEGIYGGKDKKRESDNAIDDADKNAKLGASDDNGKVVFHSLISAVATSSIIEVTTKIIQDFTNTYLVKYSDDGNDCFDKNDSNKKPVDNIDQGHNKNDNNFNKKDNIGDLSNNNITREHIALADAIFVLWRMLLENPGETLFSFTRANTAFVCFKGCCTIPLYGLNNSYLAQYIFSCRATFVAFTCQQPESISYVIEFLIWTSSGHSSWPLLLSTLLYTMVIVLYQSHCFEEAVAKGAIEVLLSLMRIIEHSLNFSTDTHLIATVLSMLMPYVRYSLCEKMLLSVVPLTIEKTPEMRRFMFVVALGHSLLDENVTLLMGALNDKELPCEDLGKKLLDTNCKGLLEMAKRCCGYIVESNVNNIPDNNNNEKMSCDYHNPDNHHENNNNNNNRINNMEKDDNEHKVGEGQNKKSKENSVSDQKGMSLEKHSDVNDNNNGIPSLLLLIKKWLPSKVLCEQESAILALADWHQRQHPKKEELLWEITALILACRGTIKARELVDIIVENKWTHLYPFFSHYQILEPQLSFMELAFQQRFSDGHNINGDNCLSFLPTSLPGAREANSPEERSPIDLQQSIPDNNDPYIGITEAIPTTEFYALHRDPHAIDITDHSSFASIAEKNSKNDGQFAKNLSDTTQTPILDILTNVVNTWYAILEGGVPSTTAARSAATRAAASTSLLGHLYRYALTFCSNGCIVGPVRAPKWSNSDSNGMCFMGWFMYSMDDNGDEGAISNLSSSCDSSSFSLLSRAIYLFKMTWDSRITERLTGDGLDEVSFFFDSQTGAKALNLRLYKKSNELMLKFPGFKPMKWTHVCLCISREHDTVSLFFNGIMVSQQTFQYPFLSDTVSVDNSFIKNVNLNNSITSNSYIYSNNKNNSVDEVNLLIGFPFSSSSKTMEAGLNLFLSNSFSLHHQRQKNHSDSVCSINSTHTSKRKNKVLTSFSSHIVLSMASFQIYETIPSDDLIESLAATPLYCIDAALTGYLGNLNISLESSVLCEFARKRISQLMRKCGISFGAAEWGGGVGSGKRNELNDLSSGALSRRLSIPVISAGDNKRDFKCICALHACACHNVRTEKHINLENQEWVMRNMAASGPRSRLHILGRFSTPSSSDCDDPVLFLLTHVGFGEWLHWLNFLKEIPAELFFQSNGVELVKKIYRIIGKCLRESADHQIQGKNFFYTLSSIIASSPKRFAGTTELVDGLVEMILCGGACTHQTRHPWLRNNEQCTITTTASCSCCQHRMVINSSLTSMLLLNWSFLSTLSDKGFTVVLNAIHSLLAVSNHYQFVNGYRLRDAGFVEGLLGGVFRSIIPSYTLTQLGPVVESYIEVMAGKSFAMIEILALIVASCSQSDRSESSVAAKFGSSIPPECYSQFHTFRAVLLNAVLLVIPRIRGDFYTIFPFSWFYFLIDKASHPVTVSLALAIFGEFYNRSPDFRARVEKSYFAYAMEMNLQHHVHQPDVLRLISHLAVGVALNPLDNNGIDANKCSSAIRRERQQHQSDVVIISDRTKIVRVNQHILVFLTSLLKYLALSLHDEKQIRAPVLSCVEFFAEISKHPFDDDNTGMTSKKRAVKRFRAAAMAVLSTTFLRKLLRGSNPGRKKEKKDLFFRKPIHQVYKKSYKNVSNPVFYQQNKVGGGTPDYNNRLLSGRVDCCTRSVNNDNHCVHACGSSMPRMKSLLLTPHEKLRRVNMITCVLFFLEGAVKTNDQIVLSLFHSTVRGCYSIENMNWIMLAARGCSKGLEARRETSAMIDDGVDESTLSASTVQANTTPSAQPCSNLSLEEKGQFDVGSSKENTWVVVGGENSGAHVSQDFFWKSSPSKVYDESLNTTVTCSDVANIKEEEQLPSFLFHISLSPDSLLLQNKIVNSNHSFGGATSSLEEPAFHAESPSPLESLVEYDVGLIEEDTLMGFLNTSAMYDVFSDVLQLDAPEFPELLVGILNVYVAAETRYCSSFKVVSAPTLSKHKTCEFVLILIRLLSACPQGIGNQSKIWFHVYLIDAWLDSLSRLMNTIPLKGTLGCEMTKNAIRIAVTLVERLHLRLPTPIEKSLCFISMLAHMVFESGRETEQMSFLLTDLIVFLLSPEFNLHSVKKMIDSVRYLQVLRPTLIKRQLFSTDAIKAIVVNLMQVSLRLVDCVNHYDSNMDAKKHNQQHQKSNDGEEWRGRQSLFSLPVSARHSTLEQSLLSTDTSTTTLTKTVMETKNAVENENNNNYYNKEIMDNMLLDLQDVWVHIFRTNHQSPAFQELFVYGGGNTNSPKVDLFHSGIDLLYVVADLKELHHLPTSTHNQSRSSMLMIGAPSLRDSFSMTPTLIRQTAMTNPVNRPLTRNKSTITTYSSFLFWVLSNEREIIDMMNINPQFRTTYITLICAPKKQWGFLRKLQLEANNVSRHLKNVVTEQLRQFRDDWDRCALTGSCVDSSFLKLIVGHSDKLHNGIYMLKRTVIWDPPQGGQVGLYLHRSKLVTKTHYRASIKNCGDTLYLADGEVPLAAILCHPSLAWGVLWQDVVSSSSVLGATVGVGGARGLSQSSLRKLSLGVNLSAVGLAAAGALVGGARVATGRNGGSKGGVHKDLTKSNKKGVVREGNDVDFLKSLGGNNFGSSGTVLDNLSRSFSMRNALLQPNRVSDIEASPPLSSSISSDLGSFLLRPSTMRIVEKILLSESIEQRSVELHWVGNIYSVLGNDSLICAMMITRYEVVMISSAQLSGEGELYIFCLETHDAKYQKLQVKSKLRSLINRIMPKVVVPSDLSTAKLAAFRHSQYYRQLRAESLAKQKDISHIWRFPLASVTHIHNRYFQHQSAGLEFIMEDGTRHFVVVLDKDMVMSRDARQQVISVLRDCGPHIIHYSLTDKRNRLASSQRDWLKGRMSNFDYLLLLNDASSRTTADLAQYPVMPWIISNYTNSNLSLQDETVFRDLSKPVGALNPERRAQVCARYETWPDEHTPPFHYGSHYSCSAVVMYYLVRLQPFTQYSRAYQGGRLDVADRLFHSVADAWSSCSSATGRDVKELIPEFFLIGQFLRNYNDIDMGVRLNGKKVNDVILPPWAMGDVENFIRLNSEALESHYVSARIHQWIDLIFGFKQKGQEAVGTCNVFAHLSYPEGMEKSMTDAVSEEGRKAIVAAVDNFGVTPRQLFKVAHPKRVFSQVLPSQQQLLFIACHNPLIKKQISFTFVDLGVLNNNNNSVQNDLLFNLYPYCVTNLSFFHDGSGSTGASAGPIAVSLAGRRWHLLATGTRQLQYFKIIYRSSHWVSISNHRPLNNGMNVLPHLGRCGLGEVTACACTRTGNIFYCGTSRSCVVIMTRSSWATRMTITHVLRSGRASGVVTKIISSTLDNGTLFVCYQKSSWITKAHVSARHGASFCFSVPVTNDDLADDKSSVRDCAEIYAGDMLLCVKEETLFLLSSMGTIICGVRNQSGLPPFTCVCYFNYSAYSTKQVIICGHKMGMLSVWAMNSEVQNNLIAAAAHTDTNSTIHSGNGGGCGLEDNNTENNNTSCSISQSSHLSNSHFLSPYSISFVTAINGFKEENNEPEGSGGIEATEDITCIIPQLSNYGIVVGTSKGEVWVFAAAQGQGVSLASVTE